jgi:hypothetical protein
MQENVLVLVKAGRIIISGVCLTKISSEPKKKTTSKVNPTAAVVHYTSIVYSVAT